MIDAAAISTPPEAPSATPPETKPPLSMVRILRKIGLGMHVALIGARHLEGGVLEAWEVKRSSHEWFLLYRVKSPQKPGWAPEHERCYGFKVSSAKKAADALTNPPTLRGWSPTSRSLRLDSGAFSVKIFDAIRKEWGDPLPDTKPSKPAAKKAPAPVEKPKTPEKPSKARR